ncbi:unnamed protein product [Arabis nemorensis]|uniref:RING-type domain-containing protein n=1 Tax=Arabis nemorensis TaxID=586526 RepID=A0A565ARV4_9BRAS|nr:unnamed protein product [Arabis nemorensis]
MDDLFAHRVSLNHEIDNNPKPEDVGGIKVYVSILMSEDSIIEPVLAFSLPAKDILDSFTRYRWEQLNCLENDERFNWFQLGFGRRKLNSLVVDVIFTNFTYYPNYYSTCAFAFYITFKYMIPPTIEDYLSFEDYVSFGEENMQVPVDESTVDNRFRPASKVAVASLSRKVYEKTTSSLDICTICLDQFKMGEIVVTLPCGHEFDHSCILEWFFHNHVCPLCRFELPCQN